MRGQVSPSLWGAQECASVLDQVPQAGMAGGTLTLGHPSVASCGKKIWLWQLTHLACGLGWFAGTPFQDWEGDPTLLLTAPLCKSL